MTEKQILAEYPCQVEPWISRQDLNYVHRFICKGKRLIYDINSSNAVEVDKMTWELLEALSNPGEGVPERLSGIYGTDKIADVSTRLLDLKTRGILFTRKEPPPPPMLKATTHMVLFLAYHCNLDCVYCYNKQESWAGQSGLMDQKTAEAAVDYLIGHSKVEKNLFLAFFGGEPLLNFPVLKHAVEYAKGQAERWKKKFNFSVTTNLILLTDEVRSFLNDNRVALIVSFDGPPDIQDMQRPLRNGGSSYTRSVANLNSLLEGRSTYEIYMRSTFTHRTIDRITDIAVHILRLGFRNISVEPAILPAHHPDALRTEDLPRVKQELERLTDRYLYELLEHNLWLLFYSSYVLDRLRVRRRTYTQCSPACGSVGVTPSGELYPCLELMEAEKFNMGDLYSEKDNTGVRDLFYSLHVQRKKKCRECWARYICGGGCHAHALKYNGDLTDPYEIECTLMKHRVEQGIWLYAALSETVPDMLDAVLDVAVNHKKFRTADRPVPAP